MRSQASLTQGNILTTLTRFAAPFLLANVLQALYGAVDLLVVGRFADSAAVSAVATGSQVMQTVAGISVGLTTGGTVLIGQYYGAGKKRDIHTAVCTILVLFGVLSLAVTLWMTRSVSWMAQIMQTPKQALSPVKQYLFICSCGVVFIVGYNAVSGILRGLGDSKTPLLFVAVACVINIAGDLLLVGVWKLGAAGAAAATVAAQALSLLFSALYLAARGMIRKF